MSKDIMNRRNFLKAAGLASATVCLPGVANALMSGPPWFQSRRGWVTTNPWGANIARGQGETCTYGNLVFLYGGTSAAGVYQSTHSWWDPTTNAFTTITPTTGSAPSGRYRFNICSSGSSIFVWGGSNGGVLNTGGIFTPSGASGGAWVATPTTGACPVAREFCKTVWCNGKYYVFGGRNGTTYYSDLSSFDGTTWATITPPGGFTITGRYAPSMAADGTRIFIWGGTSASAFNDGFIFDTTTSTWSQMAATTYGARYGHASCWTGTQVFLWGGGAPDGALYNPSTDSWTYSTITNAPLSASSSRAWWTGSKIVTYSDSVTYGIYDPAADTWLTMPTSTGPNTAFTSLFAGYANHRLLVWGGLNGSARQSIGQSFYAPLYF